MQSIGGPEVLSLRAHDPGKPGANQARIRVQAAGVNFIDTYFRSGAYPAALPFGLGLEGAGVVEALGHDAVGLSVGDRVAWSQVAASYAEAVLAPVDRLVRVPDAVPSDIAAAAMLQGMTAHYLTHDVSAGPARHIALVHAAAGGTGLLLVQLLKAAGVRVLGTCSTEAKAELARGAGADEVIRYDQCDFADEARRLTDGRGVDVVYDSVGKTTFDGSLASLRPLGLLVLFGQASGAVPAFDLQRLNRSGGQYVTRPSLAHYTATTEQYANRAAAVLDAVGSGKLSVHVGHRFPLAQCAEAHRALEGRATTGKVLLIP
jgi:NADPH2:quinone reductase